MNIKFPRILESLSPRDRKILFILAGFLLFFLSVSMVYSLEKSRLPLHQNIMTLRAQAVRLDQQAQEYHHLLALKPVTVSATRLDILLKNRIHHSSLLPSLLRMDVLDNDQVVMDFGAIPFAEWFGLIHELKSQHIRVSRCRIEALSAPGLINVTATFVRASPP